MSTSGSPNLRRELGLAQVTASGVGIIIGAGIYALLGAATVEAGASVWASFAVAGVLSALTALSYCELASMYPAAGAEFDYARRVAPAWVAFLVGWVMIVGLIVGAGAVSLGLVQGLVTVFAPAAMTYFIRNVTGARLLEKTMSKRPGWDEYAARVPLFVPRPPRC